MINSQISGTARYSGTMITRLGTGSEFLTGDMRFIVGFQAGTFTGSVSNLVFGGPDAIDRSTIPNTDSLDLRITDFDQSEISATMTGMFDEGGFFGFSDPDDVHSVDADVDFVFVDPRVNDGSTAFVASIDGDITSDGDGTRSIVGIAAGDSGF